MTLENDDGDGFFTNAGTAKNNFFSTTLKAAGS